MDTPYNVQTGSIEVPSFSGFAPWSAKFRAWQNQRQAAARISRELSSYSDAHLAELGLARSDIGDVAHGSFRRA